MNTNAKCINDITGDKLISKHATQRYRDNYDMIFHKRKKSGELGSLAEVGDILEGSQKDSERKI